MLTNLANLKERLDEEEQLQKESYLQPLLPHREKMLRLETAIIDDGLQMKGVNNYKIQNKFKYEGNELCEGGESKITLKINIKEGSFDDYVAEKYRRGLLKDVAPYLAMKASQSNTIKVDLDYKGHE